MLGWIIGVVVFAYCFYVSVHYGRASQDEEFAAEGRFARQAREGLAAHDADADRLSLDEVRFYAHHCRPLPAVSQPWWVPYSES